MISSRGKFIGKRFKGGHRFSPYVPRTPFAQWIVEICEATKLSIPELARMLGVSPHTVSKWARGLRKPLPFTMPYVIQRCYEVLERHGYTRDKLPSAPAA